MRGNPWRIRLRWLPARESHRTKHRAASGHGWRRDRGELQNVAQRCESLVREIHDAGAKAAAIQADVAKRAEVEKMFAAVEREFGRLDSFNNAGMFFPAEFEKLTDEQWDRIMDTNLKSQFLCAQLAAPIMKRQGRGRIINLSSLGGLLAWPAYTHYCVSKAGSIMLTRCLARALAPEFW